MGFTVRVRGSMLRFWCCRRPVAELLIFLFSSFLFFSPSPACQDDDPAEPPRLGDARVLFLRFSLLFLLVRALQAASAGGSCARPNFHMAKAGQKKAPLTGPRKNALTPFVKVFGDRLRLQREEPRPGRPWRDTSLGCWSGQSRGARDNKAEGEGYRGRDLCV